MGLAKKKIAQSSNKPYAKKRTEIKSSFKNLDELKKMTVVVRKEHEESITRKRHNIDETRKRIQEYEENIHENQERIQELTGIDERFADIEGYITE